MLNEILTELIDNEFLLRFESGLRDVPPEYDVLRTPEKIKLLIDIQTSIRNSIFLAHIENEYQSEFGHHLNTFLPIPHPRVIFEDRFPYRAKIVNIQPSKRYEVTGFESFSRLEMYFREKIAEELFPALSAHGVEAFQDICGI